MAGDFSLWLASASPRRAALLRQLGVSTRQFAVDVDESVEADEAPECYVRRVTHLKLETALEEIVASGENTLVPVLAADTAVIVDGESLG
ncbi:MAG: Maf family protein, partial [Pseudomonadota bacterium]